LNLFFDHFCRRSKSTFKTALLSGVTLILCSGLPGQKTIAGGLDGSRASFLLDYSLSESSLNYLSYEMSDERRSQFRQRLKSLGDTHIYLYTQNSADDVLPIGYRTWFRNKLIELNNENLKPVLWLTPDGSPNITGNIPAWQFHVTAVIENLDDQVAGYVLCLECDEYWDGATVTSLLGYVKGKTAKPVGIHLTPGPGGYNWDPTYYAGADYIFLQLGFSTAESGYTTVTTEQKKAIFMEALNLGIPVIAAEYSLDSTSAEAKAFGDWACANGAVGTGNGRTVEACGQATGSESFVKKHSGTFAVVGIAVAAVWAVSTFRVPVTMWAEDERYFLGFEKVVGADHSVGFTYGDNGSMLFRYKYRF
tara:strand:- start:980 stop:2071 length:1092 start_codon:yes stop_codon:yes gene_type:complete